MTFRTTIGGKHEPKKFLRRGIKSMFPNYEQTGDTSPSAGMKKDKKDVTEE